MRIKAIDFWSVDLPGLIAPWTPNLANSFADDAWLAPWQRVAAFGPPAAAVIGMLTPWLWPSMVESYTESVLFLMLAAAAAAFNWSFGVALLLGYIFGDSLHVLIRSNFLTLRILGGHAVGYLLFGILAVRIPQLTCRLATGARLEAADPILRVRLKAVLHGAISAGLTLLWCQGTIVLIRPVFTWSGNSPTDEAIMPVQLHWKWIVMASAIAAIGRVILQRRSGTQSLAAAGAPESREAPIRGRRQGIAWRGITASVRVVLGSLLLAVILAGTYESWIDPIIVLVVSLAVGLWRNGLLGKVPTPWLTLTGRMPALLRLAIVPVVGFAVSDVIVSVSWSNTDSLRPVMYGSLLTVLAFYIIFPKRTAAENTPPERSDLPVTLTRTP